MSYRDTRRQAVIAMLLWLAAALWTIGVSWALGARGEPQLLFGLPRWIVWGVLAPWVTFFFLHVWFCFAVMRRRDG